MHCDRASVIGMGKRETVAAQALIPEVEHPLGDAVT